MGKHEKLLQRFLSKPSDFSWKELVTLLKQLGFEIHNSGKTSGSRMRFIHPNYPPIMLHKPHPKPVLKAYQVEMIIHFLKQEGLL